MAKRLFVFACCLLMFFTISCRRSASNMITLAGSTAFQPFAEKLAEKYMESNKNIRINVQGGGSAVGIQSALSGTADIGMADLLKLPGSAASLTATTVAKDGIAIVINPKNPVSQITTKQAHDVFAGIIKNWRELGGADAEIHVISREEGSGTRSSFDALILGEDRLTPKALYQDSNGTVREAVANDENAIGYVSVGLVNERVRAVALNGVSPSKENVRNGNYSLSRPIFFLTKGELNKNVKDFIDYFLSSESQQILDKEGLIPVK